MPSNPTDWTEQATVSTLWNDQAFSTVTGSLLLQTGTGYILQQDSSSKILLQ